MSTVRILLRALVAVGLVAALTAPAGAAHAEPSASDLTKRIDKASAELEKIVESYNRINEEIKASRAASAALATKIQPLQLRVEQGRSEVGAMAVQAYKTGGLEGVNALLHADRVDALVSRLGVLEQVARKRERQLSGFDADQHRLAAEKARLDLTLARQKAQSQELAARKKKIKADLDKLYELRRAAYGSATSSGSAYSGSIPQISGAAGVAVKYAYGAVGKPYVWAADGPDGYDCSGLTLAAWRAAGKSLPHNAAMQWDVVAHIGRGSLSPGDLVFYSGLGHVGLYVGSGKVIHAPTFGDSVKISSVDMMPPYGYGRVR